MEMRQEQSQARNQAKSQTRRTHTRELRALLVVLTALTAATLLSGCGILFGGGQPEPTPTSPPRTLVPTWTPTPVQAATATPEPPPVAAAQVITVEAPQAAAPAPAAGVTGTVTGTAAITGTAATTATGTTTATAATTGTTATTGTVAASPAVTPSLKVETDIINVRLGPGTTYGLVGTANLGERFDIKGRNADGTWYQICCVNGQQGWVNAEFTDEDNEELAPLVEAPTPAPVAQAQPTQAPAAPAAQPEATATPAPAAPAPAAPSGDACAGIGGDGCKFKLRGGPKFAANGGGELKFQLHFIHSGVDGGQPQGSYFVWVEKDGQKLPVGDNVRSIAKEDQQGTLGKYNYEYKLSLDKLPGNNVAGNYVIWVLDGNGERDSQTFNFTVPDGQGEVWIEFDQG